MRSPGLTATAGALFLWTSPTSRPPFRDNAAHRSGMRSPEIRRLPPTSAAVPLSRTLWVGDVGQTVNCPLRRCPQAGTDRTPFLVAHPSGRLYGRPCSVQVRKSPSPEASYSPCLPPHPRRLPAARHGSTRSSTMATGSLSAGMTIGSNEFGSDSRDYGLGNRKPADSGCH